MTFSIYIPLYVLISLSFSSCTGLYCIVMREVMQRELSVDQQGCHFFDIHDSFITWNGSTHALPCKEYSHNCYKKKLILLFKMVILNPVHQETYFMYIESDNRLCVNLNVIDNLTTLHKPTLMLTGMGASGWVFNRVFARRFLNVYEKGDSTCPDCVAATLWKNMWISTRLVLVEHVADASLRSGLSKNNKHLPRCLEIKYYSGMAKFDLYNHNACARNDVSPCHIKSNLLAKLE